MIRSVGFMVAAFAVACGRLEYDPIAAQVMDGATFDAPSMPILDAAGEPDAAPGAPDASPPLDSTPGGCAYACTFDVAMGITDCSTPITFQIFSPGDPAVLRIDMTGYTTLDLVLEICSPNGPVFQLADSPTCGIEGGDAGDFSNDATAVLDRTTITAYANQDDGNMWQWMLMGWVSAGGCTTRTVHAADQVLVFNEPGVGIYLPTTVRLSPPTDSEGTPDRLWYVGVNRVVNPASPDVGEGLTLISFCLN